MTEPTDEREARKRYVRSRQTVVFTVVAVVMAVALVLSLLSYLRMAGYSRQQAPVEQPNFGVVAPCAPKGQGGSAATYVNNASVNVRVLNGTKFSGFAKAVGDALTNRSFTVSTIDTYSSQNVKRTIIYFGKNTIAEAYTLNSNFTDAQMVMDDRSDKLIDVVLGSTFNNLRAQKNVPAAGATITGFSTCKPVGSFKSLPKALAHDAVN